MILPDTVDPEAIADSGYEDALDRAETPVCAHYSVELLVEAQQKSGAGEEEQAAVLALLRAACSLKLDSSPGTPALVSMTPPTASYATPSLDSFTDTHLAFFEAVRGDIRDPELRARLGDIVWERKHGEASYKAALDASTRYVESAERLAEQGHWGRVTERLDRAVRLASSLNNQGAKQAALDVVRRLLDEHGEDAPQYELWAYDFLLGWDTTDASVLAVAVSKAAVRAEKAETWHRARLLWESAAGWIGAAGDDFGAVDEGPETPNDALVRAAEVHVLEAEWMGKTNGGQLGVPMQLQAAIKKLRAVGGQRERIDEIHAELLAANAKTTPLLQPLSLEGTPTGSFIETALDATEILARQAVEGKPLGEAFLKLTVNVQPQPLTERRAQAESMLSGSIGHALMPTTFVNAEGKTVARQPSSFSTSEEERDAAVTAEMFSQATRHYNLLAAGWIDPARRQILRDHAATFEDLYRLLAPSGWIPYGRERTCIRGLHAGLHGDFLVASHLLIPQFEHAIRALMEGHGHIVSSLDDRGIQDENNINALLYREELAGILGEGAVFDLKAVLINRFGFNLRNRIAHGLMHDGEFPSDAQIYVWGLFLRLTCLPLTSLLSPNDGEDDAEATTE